MTRLGPRLRWRRWRLRRWTVPYDGPSLAGQELTAWAVAVFAWNDVTGTEQVRCGERAAELKAAQARGAR